MKLRTVLLATAFVGAGMLGAAAQSSGGAGSAGSAAGSSSTGTSPAAGPTSPSPGGTIQSQPGSSTNTGTQTQAGAPSRGAGYNPPGSESGTNQNVSAATHCRTASGQIQARNPATSSGLSGGGTTGSAAGVPPTVAATLPTC